MVYAGGGAPPLAEAKEDAVVWERLLEAALERGPEALEFIEHAEGDETLSEAERKLASILREEWDWPPEHERLRQPRIAWRRHPLPGDLPPGERFSRMPSIAVDGTVTAEGELVGVRLEATTANPKLDEVILASAAEARYRPAVRDGQYVEMETRLFFHWKL
jgi:hypothetical protein